MDAMRGVAYWLTALGSSALLASGAPAGPQMVSGTRPVYPSQVLPAGGQAAAETSASATVTPDDPQLQQLLERLTALSDQLAKNMQSPQMAWRGQLEIGDVLLQLAVRDKAEEQEKWLKMAVDSFYSAAILSPENETAARDRLANLPTQLATSFPRSNQYSYAAMQDIQASYQRVLEKDGENPAVAQQYLRDRLIRFAQAYPKAPEAPKAVLDAGQMSETLGKPEDARRCYHYLTENYPNHALARKVGGMLWRLGLKGEAIELELPRLFAGGIGADSSNFDLRALRGKIVVVYFWSHASLKAPEDFQALRVLTDRYLNHGLEVVYVNMDNDASEARTFLSTQLTAGEHLYQKGGLDGPIAERYGIQELPQVFLIARDGTLLRHNLRATQLEPEVSGLLGGR
jgi:tetratricopeptide (TPR) repeat protein